MSERKIYWFDGDDAEMAQASAAARETFRYFWRELSWEARRIIQAYHLSAVKLAFSEGETVEHMWVADVGFDGDVVFGTLLNEPHSLTTIQQGDSVKQPLERLGDWIGASGDEVAGAFTINLMRSRMSKAERRQHDEAWGLEFGDPAQLVMPPQGEHHPMALNMTDSFVEYLAGNPDAVSLLDDAGWTLLQRDALAGNANIVELLLRHGADPSAQTPSGKTALDLARVLGWSQVEAVLRAH